MHVTVDSVDEGRDGDTGHEAWVGWQGLMKCFHRRLRSK